MDDTNQNPKSQNPNQTATAPVQQPIQQPMQPISGGTKEAPAGMPLKTEWVAPSTPEIVLPNEVKEAGVEAKPLAPSISDAARQQGVQMSHQNLPAPHVVVESLGLATPPGVLEQLKVAHKKVSDSLSWLVRLIMKEQDKEKNHPTDSRYK